MTEEELSHIYNQLNWLDDCYKRVREAVSSGDYDLTADFHTPMKKKFVDDPWEYTGVKKFNMKVTPKKKKK